MHNFRPVGVVPIGAKPSIDGLTSPPSDQPHSLAAEASVSIFSLVIKLLHGLRPPVARQCGQQAMGGRAACCIQGPSISYAASHALPSEFSAGIGDGLPSRALLS
jgi:hypothetical protein